MYSSFHLSISVLVSDLRSICLPRLFTFVRAFIRVCTFSQETVTLYYNLIYTTFTLSRLMDRAVKRNYASSVTRVRVNHQIISARIIWKQTASDFVVVENRILSLAINSGHIFFF